MDKYEKVLDLVEHPEKYSSGQTAEVMSDPECKEIYNLLCKTDSAMEANKHIDIDAEWEDFSGKHVARKHVARKHRTLLWFSSRAASIATIAGTSIMAVAAGIAVTVAVTSHQPEGAIPDSATAAPSAAIDSADTMAPHNDIIRGGIVPVAFENESLENIMKVVAVAYGVEVKFNNKEAALLHLYYKFDPSLPLNQVIEQLNTFEQIAIKQNGNALTID